MATVIKTTMCFMECGNKAKMEYMCIYTSDYACRMNNVRYCCSQECLNLFNQKPKCSSCGRINKKMILYKEKLYCQEPLWEKLSCHEKAIGLEALYVCYKCNKSISGGYNLIFDFCKECFESTKYESDFNEIKLKLFQNKQN